MMVAAAVGLLDPRTARADSDGIRDRVQKLQTQQDHFKEQTFDRLVGARVPGSEGEDHLAAIIGGLSTAAILKDLEAMPLEEQAHPSVQGLLVAAAEEVGRAMDACQQLLEAFLHSEDPDREGHLRLSLKHLRLTLPCWPPGAGGRGPIDRSLRALEGEQQPGALTRRVAHLVGRMRTIRREAETLAARGESGATPIQDPETSARIEAGRARWSAAETGFSPDRSERSDERREVGREILIIVGFVVMGLGTAAGVLVVLSGFISSLFGDPLAAGPMMMFAIATVLVGVLIGGLLVYAGNRSRSHGSGGSARDPPP